MTFDDYQALALRTWNPTDYEGIPLIAYLVMGMCGESGEVAEKIKKLFRNHKGQMTEEYRQLTKKELGDVLWYLTTLSYELGFDLNDIAETNINKLSDRLSRGVIKSEGDIR